MSEPKQETPAEKPLNLYQKLAKITGEVGAIKKGGRNQDQGYMFIEYAAVAGELRSLFAKYNVVIVPYMQRTDKQKRQQFKTAKGAIGTTVLIDFTFVVINADSPEEKFSVTWTGEATDYGDKATNKAATAALKYYLMRQFNISEQGDDPDAATPKQGIPVMTEQPKSSKPPVAPPTNDAPATPQQKAKIFKLLTDAGVKRSSMNVILTAEYGIATPDQITSAEASRVIDEMLANPPEVEDEQA